MQSHVTVTRNNIDVVVMTCCTKNTYLLVVPHSRCAPGVARIRALAGWGGYVCPFT